MSQKLILNDGSPPDRLSGAAVASELRRDINRLKGEFFDLERGRVDYGAMKSSSAYHAYVADTARLAHCDLEQLDERNERLAFWINLYNALVIHGVVELGVRQSVREVPDFFSTICYRIGEHLFTPDDIEHGILRGNHRHPYGVFSPFPPADPRLVHSIRDPDPRIHFTLVCASSSCPPINFYTPDRLDEQLDMAAAGFINGPEVEVRPEQNRLQLSPIFKWYRGDFGGHQGVVDLLIRHIESGEEKDFLIERGLAAEVEWKAYDWRLNR